MSQYTRPIATALRLIKKFGTSITIVRFVDGTLSDSSEPWNTSSYTEETEDAHGVFVEDDAFYESVAQNGVSESQHAQNGVSESQHAQAETLLIAASGLSFAPTLRGEIRASGSRWKILSVKALSPALEPVVYTVTVVAG